MASELCVVCFDRGAAAPWPGACRHRFCRECVVLLTSEAELQAPPFPFPELEDEYREAKAASLHMPLLYASMELAVMQAWEELCAVRKELLDAEKSRRRGRGRCPFCRAPASFPKITSL